MNGCGKLSIILNAKKNPATLYIREGNNLLCQLLRPNIIPFKFYTGILAIGNNFKKLSFKPKSPPNPYFVDTIFSVINIMR